MSLNLHKIINTYTSGQKVDGLVHATERGHIDGLTTDGTSGTNSGGVLTRSGVDNGINEDLKRILLGEEVDDLESVLHDSHSHDLLTVVAAVHHEGVGQSFHNWTVSLAESLDVVTTCGVR